MQEEFFHSNQGLVSLFFFRICVLSKWIKRGNAFEQKTFEKLFLFLLFWIPL